MSVVLVVDDHADTWEIVSKFLAKAGFEVRAAANGREALIEVATTVPDVIILDAQMPEMDGVEFLHVIRSYLRWSAVPVILLTAFDKGRHIDMARDLGVRCILLKANSDLNDLLGSVNRVRSDPAASCGTG